VAICPQERFETRRLHIRSRVCLGAAVMALSPAQLAQRQAAARTHGARSEGQIAAIARSKKRWLVRRSQLRIADLDAVAVGYLHGWARCEAQLTLLDRFMQANGSLRDPVKGEPWPFMALYVSLANSSRLNLAKLESHLQREGSSRLVDWLEGELAEEGEAR
jgi:hypothetical protein